MNFSYNLAGNIMENKIILHATDLDGFLLDSDKRHLEEIDRMYEESIECFKLLENGRTEAVEDRLVKVSRDIGHKLDEITKENDRLHIYSFDTPDEMHGNASRIIAKLRDPKTDHEEFLYYIQRAYEILFAQVYAQDGIKRKRSKIEKTPVTYPCQNYSVHMIPDCDELIHNSVMCVMLRGALLPSMIISKEAQDYSSDDYITPFALFKIKRDEMKGEKDMDYVMDLDKSFYNLEDLDGKDLIFADPMNATGGSLVTVVKYLKDNGVRPKSIKFINVISALKGAVRITRALPEAEVYTLWMDPVLNEKAYILPGLGDAGDRLNGKDSDENPRNMIQLIADYGQNIVNLYRDQVMEIEKTVLG